MTLAAEAKGVKTQVGFNYLCNPMLGLAREMIAAGALETGRGSVRIHDRAALEREAGLDGDTR